MKGAESAEGLLALPKGWPDTAIATTTTTTLLQRRRLLLPPAKLVA